MVFSILTEKYYNLILEHFYHPKQKLHTYHCTFLLLTPPTLSLPADFAQAVLNMYSHFANEKIEVQRS